MQSAPVSVASWVWKDMFSSAFHYRLSQRPIGVQVTLHVSLVDSLGAATLPAGGQLTGLIDGPAGVQIIVTGAPDGQFTVQYRPSVVGQYQVRHPFPLT